jgi:hypothetical protein
MKKIFRITLSILALSALIGLESCQKEELGTSGLSDEVSPTLKSKELNTFYSPTVSLGNGVARAWVMVSKSGDPISVGINLSAKALENLPDEPQMFAMQLPKNKGMNFYTHALFDWNPQGHEPPGVYDLPHFDFHFYIIPNEDRLSIPFIPPLTTDAPVDPMYVPAGYVMDAVTIPEMGTHWVDLDSPEWNGETFTKTFIWGSYQGMFSFWEPMITLNYLNTQPNETIPLKQPSAFQKSGWYPMSYSITYSMMPDQYTIALTDLTYHEGE